MSHDIRVFVSSTWEDLQPERRAIEAALLRMKDTTFAAMEYFGSRPTTPLHVSLAEMDHSTIYLGIVADRYGSGITEAEYHHAIERGLPCFIYFKCHGGDARSTVEGDQQSKADQSMIEKLRLFKEHLGNHHTLSYFETPEQLATQVVADLHNFTTHDCHVATDEQPASEKYSVTITSSANIVVGDHSTVTQRFDDSRVGTIAFENERNPNSTVQREKPGGPD